jgi:hypothetical protein
MPVASIRLGIRKTDIRWTVFIKVIDLGKVTVRQLAQFGFLRYYLTGNLMIWQPSKRIHSTLVSRIEKKERP